MPPRGQRLFIRPIEAADRDLVRRFFESHCGRSHTSAQGLLAKLLGELVAVIEIDIESDALRIANLVVATDLRRKRIGRAMLDEVAQLAAKMDRSRIVIDDAAGAEEFLRRERFRCEGGLWIRSVTGR